MGRRRSYSRRMNQSNGWWRKFLGLGRISRGTTGCWRRRSRHDPRSCLGEPGGRSSNPGRHEAAQRGAGRTPAAPASPREAVVRGLWVRGRPAKVVPCAAGRFGPSIPPRSAGESGKRQRRGRTEARTHSKVATLDVDEMRVAARLSSHGHPPAAVPRICWFPRRRFALVVGAGLRRRFEQSGYRGRGDVDGGRYRYGRRQQRRRHG
jgi:hypothetical protein